MSSRINYAFEMLCIRVHNCLKSVFGGDQSDDQIVDMDPQQWDSFGAGFPIRVESTRIQLSKKTGSGSDPLIIIWLNSYIILIFHFFDRCDRYRSIYWCHCSVQNGPTVTVRRNLTNPCHRKSTVAATGIEKVISAKFEPYFWAKDGYV